MCYVIDCYIGMIINKAWWLGRGAEAGPGGDLVHWILCPLPALSTLPTFCVHPDTDTPHLSSHQEIANCSCSILHQRYGGKMVIFSFLAPPTLHLASLLHHVLTARASLRSAVTLIFTQHYISSSTCKLLVLPA